MFCIRCGKENATGAVYCTSCGAPLTTEASSEKPPIDHSPITDEKHDQLHEIDRCRQLYEAEETKKRIERKFIISGVIGIAYLVIVLALVIFAAAQLSAETHSGLEIESPTELLSVIPFLVQILIAFFLPLGVSVASEYVHDNPEYKTVAIILLVASFLGVGVITFPVLTVAGIPGFFYLRNRRREAIKEIESLSSN